MKVVDAASHMVFARLVCGLVPLGQRTMRQSMIGDRYSDTAAFRKIFQEIVGSPPRAYRQRCGISNLVPEGMPSTC